jgi:hypothetical protein
VSQRAGLIRAAQQVATQYSVATGYVLESLVREVSLPNAERVLELVRRVDDEARRPADVARPDARQGAPKRIDGGTQDDAGLPPAAFNY